jgi:UDP-glucose 4-epimerase
MLNQIAASEDGWSIGILRYFNPVGAHPSGLIGEDPLGTPNNLMPIIARVALGQMAEVKVFGSDYDTPDGTGLRDYIHVMDLAIGHVRSLDALLQGKGSHLCNLGRGEAVSVLEMIHAFGQATGKSVPYQIVDRRPGDVPCYLADVRHARDVLGFEAKRDLDDMCKSTWHWIERRQLRNRPVNPD